MWIIFDWLILYYTIVTKKKINNSTRIQEERSLNVNLQVVLLHIELR